MRGVALVVLGVLLGAIPGVAAAARIAALARARRARERALRDALEARLWADLAEAADGPETEELRRRRHEANNALSTALLSAEFLAAATRNEVPESKPAADRSLAAAELIEALQRLKRALGVERAAATILGPSGPREGTVAPVALFAAAKASAARVGALHPKAAIELALASPAAEGACVAVCGGEEGLARALDALLANACEGDGTRAASRVALRVGGEGEVGVVRLEIADDGPGFSAEQLARPAAPFASTKRGRLGLGLYTAERIVQASGGSLRRENGPNGGARLVVFLVASGEPPPAQ